MIGLINLPVIRPLRGSHYQTLHCQRESANAEDARMFSPRSLMTVPHTAVKSVLRNVPAAITDKDVAVHAHL